MPPQLSYPGVYVQEIPSGVHTIVQVATSIAAFVGWAPQGPTDKPVHVYSFADFERGSGGLHPKSYLGYAVKHFFDNGGTEAYIIRLAPDDAVAGTASAGGLTFNAKGPGEWSRFYGVAVKVRDGSNPVKFRVSVVQFDKDDSGSPN